MRATLLRVTTSRTATSSVLMPMALRTARNQPPRGAAIAARNSAIGRRRVSSRRRAKAWYEPEWVGLVVAMVTPWSCK